MSSKLNEICIDQVLHGYQNGHTLLMSSTELSSDVKRIMLPMSDMSGNSMLEGFDEYITGYPLKNLSSYAIAKTWYAYEMERPGCVWTHTLIIPFAQLPLIKNYYRLLKLFRRPSEKSEENFYTQTIFLAEGRSESETSENSNETPLNGDFVKSLLHKLYGSSNKSLLIRSGSSVSIEPLFLAIWLQQWPRLRRNFSFCTGAIEPRSVNNSLLDLQCVPFRALRDTSAVNILELPNANKVQKSEFPIWVEHVYYDLQTPSLLRYFISTFGADVPEKLSSFKLLAECFEYFSNKLPKIDRSLEFLANIFNEPNIAYSLKSNILNSSKHDSGYYLPKYSESLILSALSTTQNFHAFDYVKLKYYERFLSYVQASFENGAGLMSEILNYELNPHGEEIFKIISGRISLDDIKFLSKQYPNLLSVLVALSPKWIYSRKFWADISIEHREVVKWLENTSHIVELRWVDVAIALLDVQSNIDPYILDRHTPDLAGIILDWKSQNQDIPLDKVWSNYLIKNQKGVIQWLNTSTRQSQFSVRIAISLLDPNSHLVIDNGASPWLSILEHNLKLDNSISEELSAFCFALAFNLTGWDAMRLFNISFEKVYHSLAMSRMLPFQWEYIEIHTKPLSIFKNWDRCKKVVNALVDECIDKDYNIRNVLEKVSDQMIIARLIQRYEKKVRNN